MTGPPRSFADCRSVLARRRRPVPAAAVGPSPGREHRDALSWRRDGQAWWLAPTAAASSPVCRLSRPTIIEAGDSLARPHWERRVLGDIAADRSAGQLGVFMCSAGGEPRRGWKRSHGRASSSATTWRPATRPARRRSEGPPTRRFGAPPVSSGSTSRPIGSGSTDLTVRRCRSRTSRPPAPTPAGSRARFGWNPALRRLGLGSGAEGRLRRAGDGWAGQPANSRRQSAWQHLRGREVALLVGRSEGVAPSDRPATRTSRARS